jgi:hypothetical protein
VVIDIKDEDCGARLFLPRSKGPSLELRRYNPMGGKEGPTGGRCSGAPLKDDLGREESRMRRLLSDRVALVAGATRGAGRAIAVELGAAGATVYVTGRSTRQSRSPMNRPETIEETAELVTARGGRGIAVRVDHAVSEEVAELMDRICKEQNGQLDLLVNDIGVVIL